MLLDNTFPQMIDEAAKGIAFFVPVYLQFRDMDEMDGNTRVA